MRTLFRQTRLVNHGVLQRLVPAVVSALLLGGQVMAQTAPAGRNEPITYWVVVGNEVATSGIEQKLAQMRYGLRGVIADGMLVRVSSIDPDMARGHAVQSGFIADMAAAIPSQARPRVFGDLAL